MGALRSSLKGDRSREGMKLLYAHVVGDEKLEGTAAINIVATASLWITRANMAADKAAEGPPTTSLRWILRKHYAVAQARKFGDQYQLMPAMLAEWMQKEEAAKKLASLHKDRFGEEYMEDSGLQLDWFTAAQQRPITTIRMDDLPTMRTMARRQLHYGVEMDPECLICQVSEEEEGHMWECPATIKEANVEVRRLKEWLERNFYAGGHRERNVTKALADPLNLVHMAAALQTKTMKKDKMYTTN